MIDKLTDKEIIKALECCSLIESPNERGRTDGIKKFAERLKDDSWFIDLFDRNDYPVRAVTKEDIDNLVKEMVGEDE